MTLQTEVLRVQGGSPGGVRGGAPREAIFGSKTLIFTQNCRQGGHSGGEREVAVEAAAAKVARAAGGEGGGERPRAPRACGALVPITSKQPAHAVPT